MKLHNKDNILENKYYTLALYIVNNGQVFHKKHGNWIKLDLFKDYYLSLDSWNGAILFNKGLGEYNEWTGFGNNTDKHICFLGGDFGEFKKPERKETLDWLLFNVLKIEKIEKKYL